MNYDEAVEYLFDIPRFTKKTTLEHTKKVLDIMGNPERDKKVIHVAGTNGKGSVCTYINETLLKSGKKTGLFTSPHLVKANERIKVCGRDISDEDFLEAFDYVLKVQEKLSEVNEPPLTFFEYVFAMAMYHFDKCKVEYIVLETGLGGLLDQTNAIEKPVLTVITQIGYDHMEYLGNTLEEIAAQKAGIIKENIPVIFFAGRPECKNVIEKTALSKKSPFYMLEESMINIVKKTKKCIDFSLQYGYYGSNVLSVKSAGVYQAVNAALAYMAMVILCQRDNSVIPCTDFETIWEGRMEEVLPSVIVDGGHNEDGIEAFLKSVKNFEGRKLLFYSSVGDKEYPKIIQRICSEGIFDGYYVTRIDNARGVQADILGKEFEKYTKATVYICDDIEKIFETACKDKGDGTLFCAGSLYLVGKIKEIVKESKYD